MADKKPKLLPFSDPFTKSQQEAADIGTLIVNKLFLMQRKSGKFNYGFMSKTKSPLDNYSLEQHFLTARTLYVPMHNVGHLRLFKEYPYDRTVQQTHKSIMWGCNYMQPSKKRHAEYKHAQYINYPESNRYDNNAAALLAITDAVQCLIKNKFNPNHQWSLTKYPEYIKFGDRLAQGLLVNIDSSGKFIKSCNKSQCLAALFSWMNAAHKVWIWYQKFDIYGRFSISEKSRQLAHAAMLFLIRNPKEVKRSSELIWPLSQALTVGPPNTNIYRSYIDNMVELTRKSKNARHMIYGLQHLGLYGDARYKNTADYAFYVIEAYLDAQYARVMESGAVKDANKTYYDIGLMQNLLFIMASFANYTPTFIVGEKT